MWWWYEYFTTEEGKNLPQIIYCAGFRLEWTQSEKEAWMFCFIDKENENLNFSGSQCGAIRHACLDVG